MRSWTAQHYPAVEHKLGFDHHVALTHLAAMPPVRVLDIGCADGQFLERGVCLGHDMTGIDFAENDIRVARKRGLNAHVADVDEISQMFKDRPKFDVITLFQIIEHLNEPDKILSKINEIVEPNALLIVGCPSNLRYTRFFHHPQRVQRSDFWDYPPQHTLRWTPVALEEFLLRHGWQTKRVVYEPLTIIGAASHINAIHRLNSAEQESNWRRRAKILVWLMRITISKLFSDTTGICLVVIAQRTKV